VAQRNALALGVADRLTLICSDWFAAIDGRFDLIVSNPPYIPSAAIAGLSAEVRLGDPAPALDGGPDGLAAYRAIAAGAAAHLNPGGLVLVEIGEGQDVDVERVFGVHGFRSPARGPARIADLAGRVRVLGFSLAAGR
jgi:release factor glutamine methyltransferase